MSKALKDLSCISIIFCFVSLFVSFQTFANIESSIARVEKVIGSATVLSSGALQARNIVEGMSLRAEDSIVTEHRSFVRVRFEDSSFFNIASNSQVTINNLPSDGTPIISLLRGSLRSYVNKQEQKNKDIAKENKLLLRTRNAAMGVRGTEFEVSYNPENLLTSTLTYSGSVAKNYYSDSSYLDTLRASQTEKIVQLRRRDDFAIEYDEQIVHSLPDVGMGLESFFDTILSTDESVIVKAGQFSGSAHKLKTVSQPVKISPVQFKTLYENDVFAAPQTERRSVAVDTLTKLDGPLRFQADQKVPSEGVFDPVRKIYAPKAGGLIDFNTGLYIPPEEDALFDRNHRVFLPSENSGRVDIHTGEYIPPLGLSLDSRKGFVLSSDEASSELIAMRDSLNQNIATDVVLPSVFESAIHTPRPRRVLNLREQFTKDLIEARFGGGSQTLEYEDDLSRGDRKVDGVGMTTIDLDWYHASSGRYQFITGMSYRSVDASNSFNGQYESDGLYDLRLGARYYLNSRWTLRGLVTLKQNHFFSFRDDGNDGEFDAIERVVIPQFSLGVQSELFHSFSGTLRSGFSADVFYGPGKDAGVFDVDGAFGFRFNLFARYWLNQSWWIEGAFDMSFSRYEFKNNVNTPNSAPLGEQKISSEAIVLSLGRGF